MLNRSTLSLFAQLRSQTGICHPFWPHDGILLTVLANVWFSNVLSGAIQVIIAPNCGRSECHLLDKVTRSGLRRVEVFVVPLKEYKEVSTLSSFLRSSTRTSNLKFPNSYSLRENEGTTRVVSLCCSSRVCTVHCIL